MSKKIRKYLLPNIPYLFVLWLCLKLGTAYRLAVGANFALKLIGMGATIAPAFATLAPGFSGFDWIVGITGAALLRLIVYNKVKKAKKYRRDVVCCKGCAWMHPIIAAVTALRHNGRTACHTRLPARKGK
jgi:type IV secretion system protein VirD4